MKQLICLGAKAYGVGTLGDITGYFYIDGWHDRMSPGPWGRTAEGGAPSRLPNVSCRSWSKRDACSPPMSTVGESRRISTPVSVCPGPSTPEHSSPRLTRLFGIADAWSGCSG